MNDKSKMPMGKDKQAMMEEMAMRKKMAMAKEMAMDKGAAFKKGGKTGSTKKYAKGGKVRGAGCATKGTRTAKIV